MYRQIYFISYYQDNKFWFNAGKVTCFILLIKRFKFELNCKQFVTIKEFNCLWVPIYYTNIKLIFYIQLIESNVECI